MNMLRYPFIFTIFLIFFLESCRKPENRKCYKSTGKIIERIESISEFDTLVIEKGIALKIIQSNEQKIVIRGGKNMVNLIRVDQRKSNKLTLRNENKCNFLRKMNQIIELEIYVSDLRFIIYHGSETLSSGELLLDSLNVSIGDGNGTVDLNLNCHFLDIYGTGGAGDFKVRGVSNYTFFGLASNTFCDTRQLKTMIYLSVLNDSDGDAYVNVNAISCFAYIKRKGNIYFQGTPNSVEKIITGAGKFEAI